MISANRPRPLGRLGRAFALAVGLLLLAQVAPGSAQTTQEKLERAKERVSQIEKELDAQRARLDVLRAEIESLTRQILQALRQREALQDQIAATTEKIEKKGKRVDRLRRRLGERARDAYIQGPGGVLEFVLEAGTLSDLSDRVTFLSALNEADASIASGIEVHKEELGRFEDDLQGFLEEQEALLARFKEQKKELDGKFAEQVEIEQTISNKLAEAEEVVKDLRKQRRREILAALAAQRAARAAASGGTVKPGEGLLEHCPVDSPRSYINDFGFPRSGGRSHQGNDIFAPNGTPIRAPFAGVAEESSNSLGGLAVFVRAPDGTFVYNAHLSRYAGVHGKQVNPGDLIGYVGTTGNARGTPPHDHFELHPGGGGAITPYGHLNLVCGPNGAG